MTVSNKRSIELPGLPGNFYPPAVWAGPRHETGSDMHETVMHTLRRLNEGFDQFKARQLAQINELGGDVETTRDQLKAMQAQITGLMVNGTAWDGDPSGGMSHAADRKLLATFARRGLEGIRAATSMTTDSDPDGGYTVPSSIDNTIAEIARQYSPVRALAQVAQIRTGRHLKLVRTSGATAEWRAETTTPTQTDAGQFSQIEAPEGELTATPRISQWLLDDSQFDIASELAGDVGRSFAVAEGAAFVNGNGVNRPRGFMTSTTVADTSWAWGKLGFGVSGHASSFIAATATASPADCLIDLVYRLKVPYRANAVWIMNSATAGVLRKFKDTVGRFVWTDSLVEGQAPQLLGYRVFIDENMPNIGAGNFPIAFGDFFQGYLIVDRLGTRVLRDPYTAKPFVIFYTTKRVGGVVQNYEAIKLLKIST